MITQDVALSQGRVHQQVAQDPVSGMLYATQIISGGQQLSGETAPVSGEIRDARGDLAINQVDADGNLLSVMYARGFDHGAALGVENVGGVVWLWMATDVTEAPVGSNGYGKQVVRLRYSAGAVVDYSPSLDLYNPFPGGVQVAPSIDVAAGRIAVCRRVGTGYQYATYSLADFKARRFVPLNTFASSNLANRQAFTYEGGYIYEWFGTSYEATVPPPGNTQIVVIDATLGEVITQHHRVTEPDLEYREPEGLTGVTVGGQRALAYAWAIGAEFQRRMALYDITTRTNPPDPGTKYHSWQQLVDDTRPNYDPDPDIPDDPATVPMNVEGRDYTFAVQEDTEASDEIAYIAVQDGQLDATSSMSVRYLGGASDQFYAYQPDVQQIPYDPASGMPEPPVRTNEELRLAYTEFDEPQCVALVAASRITVSFGRAAGALPTTKISGLDRKTAADIREALKEAGFDAELAAGAGDQPAHICNKNIPAEGVHLELSDAQRRLFFAGGNVTWEHVTEVGLAGATTLFYAYHNAIRRAVGYGEGDGDLPAPPPMPPIAPGGDLFQLGCNARYAAEIRETGTGVLLVPASDLQSVLTSVRFDRRLSEVSQATVVLKFRRDLECCRILEWVEPAMFDLVIYRDDDVVWEGPIVTTTATPMEITIEARDMGWWVSRVTNTSQVLRPQQVGRTYTNIVRDMILANVARSVYTPVPDWCRIKDYVYAWPAKSTLRRGRTGVQSKYMTDIIDDLTAYGIEWTCIGRGFHLRQRKTDQDMALATLTSDDLSGAVAVIRSADEGATRVFVTNQSDDNTSDNPAVTVTVARKGATPYGRLDWLVNTDPQIETESQKEADAAQLKIDNARTRCKKSCGTTIDREKKAARVKYPAGNTREAVYDAIDRRGDACKDNCDRAWDKAKKDRAAYVKQRASQLKAQEMLEIARYELANRYPMPVTVKVSDGAKLAASAPVQFTWLVPGERYDVISDFQCRPLSQAMRLTGVDVTWGAGGEEIGVSFIPADLVDDGST